MNRPMRWCGTEAAYRRHLRYRQVPCRLCAEANRRRSALNRENSRILQEVVAVLAAALGYSP